MPIADSLSCALRKADRGTRVLFDTGMGTDRLFGDVTGKLQSNLRAAGIDPAVWMRWS
jgi:hypothetical protein